MTYTDSYAAHGVPGEGRRLHALEAAFDPATTSVLARLDLPTTATSLELGAGAGSIATWLAAHRPHGHVTATDIDVRFLHFPAAPPVAAPVTVLKHDAVHDELPPGPYDLVHARALLCHLPQRDALLRRAAARVRPGGWLVIEDLTVQAVDTSPHPLLRRVTRAGEALLPGSDLRHWAAGLPDRLALLGLQDTGHLTTVGTIGDGSPTDAFWAATVEQAAQALTAGGHLTAREFDALWALHQDPAFTDTGISLVSAWGRRPEDAAAALPVTPHRR